MIDSYKGLVTDIIMILTTLLALQSNERFPVYRSVWIVQVEVVDVIIGDVVYQRRSSAYFLTK